MLRFVLLAAVFSALVVSGTCAEYPSPPHPQAVNWPYLELFRGHKFFVPNPNAPKNAGLNDNIIVRNQKRAKAVAVYFRNLLLGNPALNYKQEMVFDPEDARLRWRPEYIRKFGYRGERLVEFLGSGPTKQQILHSLGTIY